MKNYNEEMYVRGIIEPLGFLATELVDILDSPSEKQEEEIEDLAWRWSNAYEDLLGVLEDVQSLFGIEKEDWQV